MPPRGSWTLVGRLTRCATTGVLAAAAAAAREWRRSRANPGVLLVDLDAIPGSRTARRRTLRAIATAAGDRDVAYAAGHPAASRDLASLCAALDITVLPAPAAKDGADLVLLRQAWRIAARADQPRFVLYARDHVFRLLPAPYTLLVTDDRQVARSLARDAVHVRTLAGADTAAPANDTGAATSSGRAS